MNDYSQIVINLHAIARALENDKQTWVFGNDLRHFADRLHQVTRKPVFTQEEQRAYDYARAVNAQEIDVDV